MGSIPIGSDQFRRAVEFGLSVKREIASGFDPRPSHLFGWVPISLLARRLPGITSTTPYIHPVSLTTQKMQPGEGVSGFLANWLLAERELPSFGQSNSADNAGSDQW